MVASWKTCPACGGLLAGVEERSLVRCRGCGATLLRDRGPAAAAWLPLPPGVAGDAALSALAAREEEEAGRLAELIDAERRQREGATDEFRRNERTKIILLASAVVLVVSAVLLLTVPIAAAYRLPALGALLVLTALAVLLMLQAYAGSRASARRLLALRGEIGEASRRAADARRELELYLRERLEDSAAGADSS